MSRHFSLAEVNHHAAIRQHLLPGTKATDVETLVDSLIALHATDPATVFLSARARIDHFSRRDLDRALYESKSLVRWLCMRQTLHIVPRRRVAHIHQATAPRLYTQNRRRLEKLLIEGELFSAQTIAQELEDLSQRIADQVREAGSLSAQEMTDKIPQLQGYVVYAKGKPYEAKVRVGSRLIYLMGIEGRLVRGRPRGGWKSHLFDYSTTHSWMPEVDLKSTSSEDARRWLVGEYLATFGPVTLKDISWWSGFTVRDSRKAIKELGDQVEEVSVEGYSEPLLMLAEQADCLSETFSKTKTKTGWTALLPPLDPYVMGYQDRRRFLAAEYVKSLFDRNGNAGPTIWVDGRIVGGWAQQGERIVTRRFESISEAAQASINDQALQLETWLEGESIPPRFPTPLVRELNE